MDQQSCSSMHDLQPVTMKVQGELVHDQPVGNFCSTKLCLFCSCCFLSGMNPMISSRVAVVCLEVLVKPLKGPFA